MLVLYRLMVLFELFSVVCFVVDFCLVDCCVWFLFVL